jgi:hypothetical protein
MPATAETTHGQQRLGLLTSSKASVIARGKQPAWESLRDELWAADGSEFDNKQVGGAREYGHEHEAEGAAKFWLSHPQYEIQQFGPDGKPPFFVYRMPSSPLDGWLASSPDFVLVDAMMGPTSEQVVAGLEIKSPTKAENMGAHNDRTHYDQCQHGMLVTGLPLWFLFVHHGDLSQSYTIRPDLAWQQRYLERATKFIAFCYEGRELKRRKLSINDLD